MIPWRFIYYLSILFFALACSSNQHSNHVNVEGDIDKVSLGEAFNIRGKRIESNNVNPASPIPIKGEPKTTYIEPHEFLLNISSFSPFPTRLPKSLKHLPPLSSTIKGKIVECKYPKPQRASATQRKDGAKVNLRYLDVYQGMNAPAIYDMLEDRHGNIWVGTVGGGVSKYDGRSFLHFTTENGLSHNIVKCVLEDSGGNLWFGTLGGGLNKYDGKKFTHFTVNEGLSSDRILSLMEDRNGNIWIGTNEGVLCYEIQGENEGILTKFPVEGNASFQNILCLNEDQEGNIWMGTWDGAIRYTPGENDFDGTFGYLTGSEGLNGKSVLAIYQDRNGWIWFGTQEKGLSVYNPSNEELFYITNESGLSFSPVYDMLEDNHGDIWLATDGGGVKKLYLAREKQLGVLKGKFNDFNTDNGLSHDNVLSLLEDRSGNIWMGTWGGGVNLYQPNGLLHLTEDDGLPNDDIRAVLQDQFGDLWIGTWGGGIVRYEFGEGDSKRGKLTQYTSKEGLGLDNTLSMLEDRKGNLWIGTGGGGATYFDREKGFFTTYTGENGLSGYGVNTMMEDQDGNIWMGIDGGGVTRFNPNSQQENEKLIHYTIKEGLPDNSISTIIEDKKGNIWLGTQKGAACFTPDEGKINGKLQLLNTENGLRNNLVVSMLEDSEGYLWIGTWGGGLHRYNSTDSTLALFSTDNGLNNDWIMAITEDREGSIWVNTLEGFTILIADSTKNADGTPQSYQFITMGEEEGLVRTGFWWNNICLDQNQHIWWGSASGLASMNINQRSFIHSKPELTLTTIQINQEFVDYRRLNDQTYIQGLSFDPSAVGIDSVVSFANYPATMSLPYHLNKLTFDFSIIDWSAPQKIKFIYTLKGAETTQEIEREDHIVEYSNLPYGRYILTAKAIRGDQIESDSFEYSFRIRPPWWHTWWARILYAMFIGGALYSLYRYQLKRKLTVEEARRIKELDQFKARFFTNITHEFRTPITVIMGMNRKIKGHLNHKNLIERNSQRLLQLVNQLLDLSKLEAGHLSVNWVQQDIISYLRYLTESFSSLAETKEIKLTFLSENEELIMDYDPEFIHHIMTNLLSNALKFTSEDGQVEVKIRERRNNTNNEQTKRRLEITVRDTGSGIPMEDLPFVFDRFYQSEKNYVGGTGIGLAFVKELVEKIAGNIQLESEQGKGSSFIINLPISHQASIEETTFPEIASTPENPINEKAELTESINNKLATVLIIEDHVDVSEYIEQCLTTSYHIIKAYDGQAGIGKALQEVPDLIITDVMMPKKNGYEVCKTLKTNRISSHIPILMLTAKATEAEKIEGLKYGADAYLIKPFNEEELNIRLHNLLELQQAWQTKFQTNDFEPKKKEESLEDKFINEARSLILAHLDESSYGVEEFSKEIGLSRTQLHRKLKAIAGLSATQFINDIRLTEADKMLRSGTENVSEVAYASGFEYPNYFSKLYKKKFGQTPSEIL